MKKDDLIIPDYLFEVSWEVCNKVGGIHTVITTKSLNLQKKLNYNNYILIGPDIVRPENYHPEFVEDDQLFASWKRYACNEGLRFRTGRWQIEGDPIVILLDFSNWIRKKNEIFSLFWEKYKLDSLSGQWDYVEPALFGYAAGKVIESFILYHLGPDDKVVAQFHEWLTGTGILYLEDKVPQVATIFTTHATVIGRSLAANKKPLYGQLEKFNSEQISKELNIISKHSLEKTSARHADVFTTVSDLTARECKHFLGKGVDLITPNGFDPRVVPSKTELAHRRVKAREKCITVAEALLGYKLSGKTMLLATSGRYEFRNKGIDLFIDAMVEVNKKADNKKDIVAFIFVPASHYGPRKILSRVLSGEDVRNEGSKFLTHDLHYEEYDPVMQKIQLGGLKNESNNKVKLIFVPAYLDGNDGIFNLEYYDLLCGMDQTVFPSYYEPWGYTPLESLAFSVPTITTTLAGFGLWVKKESGITGEGIVVIERTDENDDEVVQHIADQVIKKYLFTGKELEDARDNALSVSKIALWSTLINHYFHAFDMALRETEKRSERFIPLEEKQTKKVHEQVVIPGNQPVWRRIIVKPKLPEPLSLLHEIAGNLWWTWDDEAEDLFRTIDIELWELCNHNPFILFEHVSLSRLKELSGDEEYTGMLQSVYGRFQEYMDKKSQLQKPKIAYFSMEYGIHESVKLYSGGLGLLAGDYLKEASDSFVDIVATGILYRYGYFDQMITVNGEQQAQYEYQHFSKMPLIPVKGENGEFKKVSIVLPGRTLYARIWLLNIGRVKLYLLDTDFSDNIPEDRVISHQLYGGDNENRLKQELLLGIGGIRMLKILGINPDLYHSNEGHSAFIGIERMMELIQHEQLSFEEAKEIVKAATLFTTHTPVPAGHDSFEEDLLRKYIAHYPERLKISWDQLMALGRADPNDWEARFNMSFLASNLAQNVNGVSMLHGAVTQEMLAKLWPGYLPEELHINYVTNGVHLPSWKAKEWYSTYEKVFAKGNREVHDPENWRGFYDIVDKEIWDIKQILRRKLIHSVREKFKENWIRRHEDPKQIIAIRDTLSENALTVCFARRFATYKRAHLLFGNLERLSNLLNNEDMPVQFIFAGKAHPHDKGGQELIKKIIEISKRPEFIGKILFLQNYDIALAKLLVQGSDIWLNTPTRPLEASGTSGEKAIMNGTLHFSVLDGWWVEGYKPEAGWALTNERTYENQIFQDNLDAEIIYSLFEQEIIPMFYDRGTDGIPNNWIKFIKNSFALIAPYFTTNRMIENYKERFYYPQYDRSLKLLDNDNQLVKKIASWKRRIGKSWENIEVLEVNIYDKKAVSFDAGTEYSGQVILDLNEVPPANIGVELVLTENMTKIILRKEFEMSHYESGRATYNINVSINQPGTFTFGIRVFPKYDLLPHRMDFPLMKWI